jgi:maltose phosphorylase
MDSLFNHTHRNTIFTDTYCREVQPDNDSFQPELQIEMEDKLTINNGYVAQRGNFEELFGGKSIPGTYIDGIVIQENAPDGLSLLPDWTSTHLLLNAEHVDLYKCDIKTFSRELNRENGLLVRSFEIITPAGYHIEANVQRFLSMSDRELGVIRFQVKSINFEGKISFTPVIDGAFPAKLFPDKEPEWNILQSRTQRDVAHLWLQIRHSHLQVCQAISYDFLKNNMVKKVNPTKIEKQKVAGFSFGTDVKPNEFVTLYKYVSFVDSLNHNYKDLTHIATEKALAAREIGWNTLLHDSNIAWDEKWRSKS